MFISATSIGQGVSVFEKAEVGDILSMKSMSFFNETCSVVGNTSRGNTLSLRYFFRVGSAVSVRATCRLGDAISLLDVCAVGFSVSIKCASSIGQ